MATKQSQQLHETVRAVEQRAREAGFIDNPRLQLNETNPIEASDVLAEAESTLGSFKTGGPE